jgi:hypothetical protein
MCLETHNSTISLATQPTLSDILMKLHDIFDETEEWRISLNLNVGCNSLGRFGIGDLIRVTNGNWLLNFSCSCDITININAELHTIFYSLEKTWSYSYRYVECEFHCQSVGIKLIKDGFPTTHSYTPTIDFNKRFIDYPWLLSFYRSIRKCNSCAD